MSTPTAAPSLGRIAAPSWVPAGTPFEVTIALTPSRWQAIANVELQVIDSQGLHTRYHQRGGVNPGGEVILRFSVPGVAPGRATLIAEIEIDGVTSAITDYLDAT